MNKVSAPAPSATSKPSRVTVKELKAQFSAAIGKNAAGQPSVSKAKMDGLIANLNTFRDSRAGVYSRGLERPGETIKDIKEVEQLLQQFSDRAVIQKAGAKLNGTRGISRQEGGAGQFFVEPSSSIQLQNVLASMKNLRASHQKIEEDLRPRSRGWLPW